MKFKVLKKEVWAKFQAACDKKRFEDLACVGGTWCYICTIEDSVCRDSICPRIKELTSNPANFEELSF